MNDEQIIKLVKSKEESIIGLLKVNDLVELISEHDGYNFNNVLPTEKGKALIGKSVYFDDDWLKELIKKWPPTLRDSKQSIRSKCELFISKTGADLFTVERLIDMWLEQRKPPYCGKMGGFFYKQDESGHVVSQIEILFESLEEGGDFRFEQV